MQDSSSPLTSAFAKPCDTAGTAGSGSIWQTEPMLTAPGSRSLPALVCFCFLTKFIINSWGERALSYRSFKTKQQRSNLRLGLSLNKTQEGSKKLRYHRRFVC